MGRNVTGRRKVCIPHLDLKNIKWFPVTCVLLSPPPVITQHTTCCFPLPRPRPLHNWHSFSDLYICLLTSSTWTVLVWFNFIHASIPVTLKICVLNTRLWVSSGVLSVLKGSVLHPPGASRSAEEKDSQQINATSLQMWLGGTLWGDERIRLRTETPTCCWGTGLSLN